MKKSLIVLAVLLLVGAYAFAEVEVGGEFMFGITDLGVSDAASAIPKAELNFSATIDENTTVAVELDVEGADWTGQAAVEDDPATADVDESAEYMPKMHAAVDDFRVTSNLTGALGIDVVDLVVTAGYFDAYHCNWNYVSRSGEEYYYSDEAGTYLWAAQPSTSLSANIALSFAGYTLQYWQDLAGENMSTAVSGEPLEGLNFLLGYASAFAAVADGSLWVEAGYSIDAGPVGLFIPASFTYDLGDSVYGWSSGVAVDYDAYHLGVGVGGSSSGAAFKDCLVEVSTSVVENADLYVIADLDFSASSAFQSVDIGGKYNFGAFGLGAGYVAASADDVSTVLWGDCTSMSGSGAYIYADVDL